MHLLDFRSYYFFFSSNTFVLFTVVMNAWFRWVLSNICMRNRIKKQRTHKIDTYAWKYCWEEIVTGRLRHVKAKAMET